MCCAGDCRGDHPAENWRPDRPRPRRAASMNSTWEFPTVKRTRLAFDVAGCLLLVVFMPIRARAGEPLSAAIEAVINGADYKHAHWGVLVLDIESNETVYELNADKLFAPASTT